MIALTVTVQQVWPWPKGGAVFTGKDDEGKHHRILAGRLVLHRPSTSDNCEMPTANARKSSWRPSRGVLPL